MASLKPSKKEVLACRFSSWYSDFRNINPHDCRTDENISVYKNVTMKSIIIPLPEVFVIDYLSSDGIRLPLGATKLSSCAPPDHGIGDDDWSSEDESNDSKSSDESSDSAKQFYFPELNEHITKAIDKLGGSSLPKLNWSSPKDAKWVNEGTLKCQTAGDVYLLLKSSDFIMYDVHHAMNDIRIEEDVEDGTSMESKYELVLRKWCNLYDSMEFRCFVANHRLVAISQRNHTQHYPHLTRDYLTLRSYINEFFSSYIQHTFAKGHVSNYVFDCYIDKSNRVWILDFNVWAERTDALLFTWEELVTYANQNHPSNEIENNTGIKKKNTKDDEIIEIENINPEMRVVLSENEVHYDPLASFRAPIDTVDLAADKQGANSFEEFMKMCVKPSE